MERDPEFAHDLRDFSAIWTDKPDRLVQFEDSVSQLNALVIGSSTGEQRIQMGDP